MSKSLDKKLIQWEMRGAVVAAIGVAFGLIGVLFPARYWSFGLMVAMIISVVVYAGVRYRVGKLEILALDEPQELHAIACKIIMRDAWANIFAAIGVAVGLIGILLQGFVGRVMVVLMVVSIVVYASLIYSRSQWQIEYENNR